MNVHRILLVTALAIPALVITACQPLPKQYGLSVQTLPVEGRLVTINPNDVVVAPIELSEEGLVVPVRLLRQAAVSSLVARRYAPLSLDFIDASIPEALAGGVLEASYRPGSMGEDAVLRTIIHGWDTSLWNLRKALIVDIECILAAPGGTGQELWHVRMSQRFDFEKESHTAATESALMAIATRTITDEIFTQLPQRSVGPGAH